MDKLIYADCVLNALGIFNDRENGNEHFLNGIETAMEIIEQAPAIDAVPVLRCKDCKYWWQDDPAGDGCECNHIGGWWLPEEYCSCGERRDNSE